MFDLLIRGGSVVDGTGRAPFTADVGISDGLIREVGRLRERAARVLDADGALVTPGFVDLHTHYDGQATWDPLLAPSSWHGVTTVAMGNCGVGFAPARPDRHEWLIGLLEGVEDIPGSALAEGLPWGWESFPEYLSVLERFPRVIDVAAHVPHAALRAYVMGDRGANPDEPAGPIERATMADLLAAALDAGAVGFATSRTAVHRTSSGAFLGTLRADREELVALASVLAGRDHGVIQLISDLYRSDDSEFVAAELGLVAELASASGRPVSFTVQQAESAPGRWQEVLEEVAGWRRDGLGVRAQVAPRPIGLLLGLEASTNPLVVCPSYQEVAGLPLPERVAALADPERRAAILAERAATLPRLPAGGLLSQIVGRADRMFRLEDPVTYDLDISDSIGAQAEAARREPAEALYDVLLEQGGRSLIYLPVFNFVDGTLDTVRGMVGAGPTLFGLSDAGAHCGSICDASMTTSYLTLWARDRRDGLPLEDVVRAITSAPAEHVGWLDRGVLAPGRLGDVNVIDLDALACCPPEMVRDLPAGGRRLVQRSRGYAWTVKAGVPTFEEGRHTGELPGRLVRGATAPGPG